MEYMQSNLSPDDIRLKRDEKRDIRYFSVCAAMAVTGYIILSRVYGKAVSFLGLRRLVGGTQIAQQSFTLFATVVALLAPFLFIGWIEKKRTDIDLAPLGKSSDTLTSFFAVFSGWGICVAGSLVTSVITFIFSMGGVTLTQPDISAPSHGYALFIYILRLTIAPALIEELCFRGIIMQPLRKYGDMFAVIMSAFVFAVTHGNLIQAPAAFISGIGLGYIAIATGTLWTSIAVHFLNNAFVAVLQFLISSGNEEAALLINTGASYLILIIGVICGIFFVLRRKTILPGERKRTSLKAHEKLSAYILNPAMIAALFIMAIIMRGFTQ